MMRTLVVVLAITTLPALEAEAAPDLRTALRNARRNATALIERGLDAIDATPKQRSAIRRHLAQTAVDLWGLRGEALGVQDAFAAALLAEEIDEDELDRLEQEGIELVTRGARVTRAGVLRAAAELTPRQKKDLLRLWRNWVRQVAGS